MAEQPSGLVPDYQDEVIITVRHLEGQPAQLGVLRRRVHYRRGSIVLAQPEAEPISEADSVAIILELLRAATIPAIQMKESAEAATHHLQVIKA